MKGLIKYIASKIDIDAYQRLMTYAILENKFRQVYLAPVYARRELLWDECIERQLDSRAKITFVEFGVHAGYSINYFAQRNLHEDSTFIGLDSFEGLPEKWGAMPKGTFDKKGKPPETTDPRIIFIKGWFQDTWDELNAHLSRVENLVVHYDADLYSSTLFALTKMDTLKKSYVAIFDEFTGHETRAIFNYAQADLASVFFIGRTLWEETLWDKS
ncbi:MAG: hypothetical protein ABIZ36_10055 [Gemmatimonadaceae bacterium]